MDVSVALIVLICLPIFIRQRNYALLARGRICRLYGRVIINQIDAYMHHQLDAGLTAGTKQLL